MCYLHWYQCVFLGFQAFWWKLYPIKSLLILKFLFSCPSSWMCGESLRLYGYDLFSNALFEACCSKSSHCTCLSHILVGPNPALRNSLATREMNDRTSSSRNASKNRPQTTSGFGSNIHTLKRDEDDDRFSDRNAFWNGNSTQYGGDNGGK